MPCSDQKWFSVEAWIDVLAPGYHPFTECPQMPHKVSFPSAGTKPGGFGYSLVGALDSPSRFSQELHDKTSSSSLFWRSLAPGTSGVSSKAWMDFGSRVLFIPALADKAHYIIPLEEKFSAAACVARGVGGCLKNNTDFCFFLSFRAIFLPIAGKLNAKKLQKWEGKGQCAAALAIPGFIIIIISFPKTKGGKIAPLPRASSAPSQPWKAKPVSWQWQMAPSGSRSGSGSGRGRQGSGPDLRADRAPN